MGILKKQLLLCFLLISVFHSIAFAHLPEQSYIYLQIRENSIAGRFEISTKDLNKVFNLHLNAGLAKEELAPYLAKFQEYVLQNASFSATDGSGYRIRFTEPDILRAEVFGDFVLLKFELEGVKKIPEKINVIMRLLSKILPDTPRCSSLKKTRTRAWLTTNQCIRLSFRRVE